MSLKSGLSWLLFLALIFPFVAYGAGQFIPFYDSFIVTSGSMEPEIKTGSVIYVIEKDPSTIAINDTITFSRGDRFTTHKVIEKGSQDEEYYFRTKGIANEEPDPGRVNEQDIVGNVVLTVPYIGYILDWAGTFYGMAFLVIIPAAIISAYELKNILTELNYLEEGGGNLSGFIPSLIPSLILLLLSGILAWQIFLRGGEIPINLTEAAILIIVLLFLGIIILEIRERTL